MAVRVASLSKNKNESEEQSVSEDESEEQSVSGEESENEESASENGSDGGEVDEDDEEAESENEKLQAAEKDAIENREDKMDDLTYDVYNLTACDYHPVRLEDSKKLETKLNESAQRAAQLLYKKLLDLPTETSDVGILHVLPPEVFVLPRAYRLPEKKPETRWEKFAKDKGIQKKKRDRMIYDEDSQQFMPRFGYKRAKSGLEDIPIVEVKKGEDPFADPWAAESKTKKDNVKKNLKNQRRNEGYADRAMGKKKEYGSLL